MTVQEFIERIEGLILPAWDKVDPVFEDWGDGVNEACAVTALALTAGELTSDHEDYILQQAKYILAKEARRAGIAETLTFADSSIAELVRAFDGASDPKDCILVPEADVAGYVGCGRQIGWKIGNRLRKKVLKRQK